jgi:DNA polymerase-3 subunit epsilon
MTQQYFDAEDSFYQSTFSVVDVETTGSFAATDRIIEFAGYKVHEGKIIDGYNTLINPRRHIPNFISNMTGITNEMVYNAPSFREVAGNISRFLEGTVFVAHNSHFDYSFVKSEMERAGFDFDMPQLCTRKLSSRLLRHLPHKALDQVCHHLGIKINGRHRAYGDARATAHLLIELLGMLIESHGVVRLEELLSFQNAPIRVSPSSASENGTNSSGLETPIDHGIRRDVFKIAMLSASNAPGVYKVYDREGEVIYIGKAKNLKLRMASYLVQNDRDSEKVERMLREAERVEFETTYSELHALLKELKLIREHKPRFNSLLLNPRRFPFIKLSSDKKYSRLDIVYDLDEVGRFFGPFENSYVCEQVLIAADKYFKLVKCNLDFDLKEDRQSKRFAPCLYFHIEKCLAPCHVAVDEEYAREVEAVEEFLSGSFEKLTGELRIKLDELAKKLEFEEAAEARDLIKVLEQTSRRLKLIQGPVDRTMFLCGWVHRTFLRANNPRSADISKFEKQEYELYSVRRGIVSEPVRVDEDGIESAVKHILQKPSIVTSDFVPLRILLGYALKNPTDFFKVEVNKETDLHEITNRIKAAVDLNARR